MSCWSRCPSFYFFTCTVKYCKNRSFNCCFCLSINFTNNNFAWCICKVKSCCIHTCYISRYWNLFNLVCNKPSKLINLRKILKCIACCWSLNCVCCNYWCKIIHARFQVKYNIWSLAWIRYIIIPRLCTAYCYIFFLIVLEVEIFNIFCSVFNCALYCIFISAINSWWNWSIIPVRVSNYKS